MNTSKQVNAMIGLLGLLVLVLGAYFLNESNRQVEAREEITHRNMERGSRLFVNNCRGCHGLNGKGAEEGAFAPPLHQDAFLILAKDNPYGAAETPAGEAEKLRNFIRNTISCGRTGTAMPTWAQRYGGPLSDTQVDQLVTMITTPGGWDVQAEINDTHMEEANEKKEAVLVKPADIGTLSVTQSNCGQYSGEAAAEFRTRDPFAAAPAAGAQPKAAATSAPEVELPPGAARLEAEVSEWAVKAPATTTAGTVGFAVKNAGAVQHEFVVIKATQSFDQLPVAGGLVNEKQVQVVGRTKPLNGGQSANLSVKLDPGTYALICNISGHYQLGMRASITVQ